MWKEFINIYTEKYSKEKTKSQKALWLNNNRVCLLLFVKLQCRNKYTFAFLSDCKQINVCFKHKPAGKHEEAFMLKQKVTVLRFITKIRAAVKLSQFYRR